MRNLLLVSLLCTGWTAAHAATYTLTYTSKPMKKVAGEPTLGGVKKLIFTYTFDTVPSGCNSYYNKPTNFTDGIDTIASLESAGYSVTPALYLCADAKAHPTSWEMDIYGYKTVGQFAYNYQATSVYVPNDSGNGDYVYIYSNDPTVGYVGYDANANPGKWSVKKMKD